MGFFQRIFGSLKISDTPCLVAENDPAAHIMEMSKEKALQLSTVFACVRLLSETVGTLPCVLYRREGAQGKTEALDNSLYTILRYSPNADFTHVEYFERAMADLCLWGNHFAEISRSASGNVVALQGISPYLVNAYRDMSGTIHYWFADPYGKGWREIPEENMLHIRGFGKTSDDIFGLSPISCARVSLDIASSVDAVAAHTYRNGMRPSAFIKSEKILRDDQQEKESAWFQKLMGGIRNSGTVPVIPAGYDLKPWTINPNDAQMLENRSFSVEDICRWFRVPPFMVGHTEKSTSWGSGLEQQGIAFATYTLKPYLDRIEAALHKKLIPIPDKRKYVIEFNLDGLLRADSAGRAQHYSTALQNGWMSRNEVRAKENMGKVDGGDTITVQSNLIPIQDIGKNYGNGTQKPAS